MIPLLLLGLQMKLQLMPVNPSAAAEATDGEDAVNAS